MGRGDWSSWLVVPRRAGRSERGLAVRNPEFYGRPQPSGIGKDLADNLRDIHRSHFVLSHKRQLRQITVSCDLSADGRRPAIYDHSMFLSTRVNDLERADLAGDVDLKSSLL